MFPILRSDRLLLRKIIPTDLENIYKGLSNPRVTECYGLSYDSLEATKEQIDRYAYLENSGTGNWWAICFSENHCFLGAAGFTRLDNQNRNGEVGYWLLPEYWGIGFMQEALGMVCRYGFEELDLHRIQASVESENVRSKNLLKRLDFRYEGTLKDCEIKDGAFISYDLFAKLKGENGNTAHRYCSF